MSLQNSYTFEYLQTFNYLNEMRRVAGRGYDVTVEGKTALKKMNDLWPRLGNRSQDLIAHLSNDDQVVSSLALHHYLLTDEELLRGRIEYDGDEHFDDTERGEYLLDCLDLFWYLMDKQEQKLIEKLDFTNLPKEVEFSVFSNHLSVIVESAGARLCLVRVNKAQFSSLHALMFPERYVKWWRKPFFWFKELVGKCRALLNL